MTTPSSPPMVSVVMAVYNCEQYLEEAVESILRQTFADFEFIIFDDGSTDGSGEWLEAKAKEDPRIRLIRQENIGLTKALNRGLTLARGEFVARMDADDIALPQRFQLQVGRFNADPELVLLGSEVEMTDKDGLELGSRGTPLTHVEIRKQLLAGNGGAVTHPVAMFRTESARLVGGYDERMTTTQEVDFFLRLSEVGKVANLPETLLFWRQHNDSSNHRRSDEWPKMFRHCVREAIRRRGLESYLEDLFPHTVLGAWQRPVIYDACLARKAGRFRTATKLFAELLRVPGDRLSAFQGLCEVFLLRISGAIFNRIRRLQAAVRSREKTN